MQWVTITNTTHVYDVIISFTINTIFKIAYLYLFYFGGCHLLSRKKRKVIFVITNNEKYFSEFYVKIFSVISESFSRIFCQKMEKNIFRNFGKVEDIPFSYVMEIMMFLWKSYKMYCYLSSWSVAYPIWMQTKKTTRKHQGEILFILLVAL